MANPIISLLKSASKRVFSSMNQKVQEQKDAISNIKKATNELKENPSFWGLIKFLYILYTNSAKVGTNAKQIVQEAEHFADNVAKQIQEKIKGEIKKKIAKLLMKLAKVIIKAFAKLIQALAAVMWPYGVIAIVVIAAIVFFVNLWPSLTNLFSFSYGFNKADYYDTELFQQVKNKETMLENVYSRTAETSYYQRFANSEISDFLGFAVPNLEEAQTKYGKSYKEAAKDAQAGFTGFYTMDDRETAHDANFNTMTNVIQANTLDTSNGNRDAVQGYFRDLFDKETNFILSEQFLRQANTYVQDMGNYKNNQLHYPEMFTKPLAYTVDFNRIDLFKTVEDGKVGYVWKDYTYTTKRVTPDDVGLDKEKVLRNINESYYASNYYGSSVSGTVSDDEEGLIISWPSPFVWDYAVYKKDYYQVYNDGTGQVFDITDEGIIDNEYNSEYLTIVNDETGDIEKVRLFYEMTGGKASDWSIALDSTHVDETVLDSWLGSIKDAISDLWAWLTNQTTDDYDALYVEDKVTVNSYGLAGDGDDYVFTGDVYTGVISDTFSTSVNTNPYTTFSSNFKKVTEDGEWLVITIPDGYRLPTDKPAYVTEEDGTKTFQPREKDEIRIRKAFNKYPKRHVQTVQLTGEDDEIAVSSQNLINYKYYKIKTVTEAYRNRQEYVDGWGDYILSHQDDLTLYADRNIIDSLNNRINGVKKSIASSVIDAFTPEEHSLENYGEDYEEKESVGDEYYGENTEAMFNIIMEYPEEVLSLSLYGYERELVRDQQENDVWVWNYSVNNYFKTDNDKMDGYEYFQKYFYLYEELKHNKSFLESAILDNITDEYNTDRPWYTKEIDVSSLENQLINGIETKGGLISPYVTGKSRHEVFWDEVNGFALDNLFNPLSFVNTISAIGKNIKHGYLQIMGKEVNQEDLADILEKITGKMHTAYLNLGTIRKSAEEGESGDDSSGSSMYSYIPSYNPTTASETQYVIGMDITGKNRAGEGSLISTFYLNDSLYEEAITYSYLTSPGSLPDEDTETSFTFTNEAEAIKGAWTEFKEKVSAWWNDTEYTAIGENWGEHTLTFPYNAEEHNHYQYEYYITSSPQANHSGVYNSNGVDRKNELPLEVRSVRDYGLASILNYVDSITVEFYSGAWYDEVYLRKEIGEGLYSAYADVYSTYSFSEGHDDWFNKTSSSVSLKGEMAGKAISGDNADYAKAVSIIGNGYYPKEMREDASDYIVELFEQNNKKHLFTDLVDSIDAKIFEVTNEYDQVLWDEEKHGELKIADKTFNLLTDDFYNLDKDTAVDNIGFNVDVMNDALVGGTATFRLLNKEGNPIGADDYDFEANQIYRITNDDSKFYYYMPEIKLPYEKEGITDEPNRIIQLLIPKRYYRNWVKTLSLDNTNGSDWPLEKVYEMSLLERIRTLILRKNVLVPDGIKKKEVSYLKTADVSLPSSNIDAILRGLSTVTTGYSVGPEKEFTQANLANPYGSGDWPNTINPYESQYEYNAGKDDGNAVTGYYGRSPWQTYSKTNNKTDNYTFGNAMSTVSMSQGSGDSATQITGYYTGDGRIETTQPSWWFGINAQRFDKHGNEIKYTDANGYDLSEKQYYEYILDTYSSKNFRSGINRFDFITDSDVEKVFVIDEVATFTGRFMYTYKDTLLPTGDSLDPDSTKGILSAYAMDRYVFLDSWDIKLLTEQIIDVSFMWMNVQPTVDGATVSSYIKTHNENIVSGQESSGNFVLDVINAVKTALAKFVNQLKSDFANNSWYDQFYDNAFLYAVPASMVDELKSYNGDDSNHWESDSQIRKEIESYTNMIFSGFVFMDTNLPDAFKHTFDGVHSDFSDDTYNETFDLLSNKIEYQMDEAIVNGMANDAIASMGGYSAESFIANANTEHTDSNGTVINTPMSDDEANQIKEAWNRLANAYDSDEVNSAIYDILSVPYLAPCLKYEGTGAMGVYREFSEGHPYEDLLGQCQTFTVDDGNGNQVPISEDQAAECAVTFYKAHAMGWLSAMAEAHSYGFANYDWPYEAPSPSLLDMAKEAINNLAASIADALLQLCTGFRITSQEFSLCAKVDMDYVGIHISSDGVDSGLDLSTYKTEMTNKILPSLFNRYIKLMGYKEEGESIFGGFDFDFEVYEGGNWITPDDGSGKAKCYANIYTYSLKCSDEIANKVKDGRYYSYVSSLNLDFNQDNNVKADIEHIDDFTFVKDWKISNSMVSSTYYGSLVNVRAEQILEDIKGKGIYDNEITISNYNGAGDYKTSLENLWRPQVKIFDNFQNLNEKEIGYGKDSMKELLYGAYLKNNGAAIEGNINISTDSAVDSSGNYKNGVHLHRVDGTANSQTGFFFRFIQNSIADTGIRDALINIKPKDAPMGFKLWESQESKSFTPDEDTSREEEVFQDKFNDVYIDNKVAAINPIEVLYGDTNSSTGTSDKADKFVAFLNQTYGETVKNIVNSAHYAFDDGHVEHPRETEDFAITGFVLVPRLTDRRDEPTLYPLYRYYGGTKKKIIPEEQVKYFEGLTYDSWKNKMTITESSPVEKIERYTEEMDRLSNYIYSYFENFESYVPYNIITDSDLEIRGTAGYADLLTQYTLYPVQTIAYTNLFTAEANKPYWNDICQAFNIPNSVIAQLLQGISETKLKYLPEDAAALMDYEGIADYSNDLTEEISSKTRELIGASRGKADDPNFFSHLQITTKDGNLIPIVGIMAIDNFKDKDMSTDVPEEFDSSTSHSGPEDIVTGAYMISDHSGATACNGLGGIITGSSAQDLYGQLGSIPEDTEKIIISLSAKDLESTGTPDTGIDTVYIRRLIKAATKAAPNAKLYFLPVTPVKGNNDDGTGGYNPSPWTAETLNAAVETANRIIKEYIEENIPNGEYVFDAVDSVLADDASLKSSYSSDMVNLNSSGFSALVSRAKDYKVEDDIPPEDKDKSTWVFPPASSETMKPYEIAFDIYHSDPGLAEDAKADTITDGRLVMEDAIQYASVRLYKSTKSLGDLLKAVYASFYSDKFVKALIVVTEDNATNRMRNAEHGLWYRPTDEDIQAAFELLNDADRDNINWRDVQGGDLHEIYGINRLQEAFSYITNQDYRKLLVTYSMNSGGSASGLEGIMLDDAWDIGANADATRAAANKQISGTSLVDGRRYSATMIDYITQVCSNFSTPEKPLDPALVMALIMVESGGNPDIKQYGGGPGRGLAQHSIVNGDLKASATDKNGQKVSITFNYSQAFDPMASIDYIVMNYAGTLQNASYDMHPLTAIKTHNLPVTLDARLEFSDEYPLTPEGDLQYLYNYENGLEYQGYKRTHQMAGSAAARAASVSEAEYRTKIPMGENFGYGCPRYCTKILSFYAEEFANGDLFSGVMSTGNKRDYSEEIWEEEYLKYENSGVELLSGNVNADDVDNLIKMTANYRNNNTEAADYSYTYLDFFREEPSVQKGSNEFTGEMGDSLILNAMTYLGAHYSQGRAKDAWNGVVYSRTSHAENLGGGPYATPWGANSYGEGTFAAGNKWAFDCSSFGAQMYAAMGYNLTVSTCSTYNANFGDLYVGNAAALLAQGQLKTGDLLVSSGHTIVWIGDYTTNYGGLFDDSTLRILGNQIIRRSGTEVLSFANSNVNGSQRAYIHSGGYRGGGSCVNIKDGSTGYLAGFSVYRFFRDDLDYNQSSLSAVSPLLCPTIFTKTTLKNNPYLVEYMEDSGILEAEMAKGQFDAEDVAEAQAKINSVRGDTKSDSEYDMDEYDMSDEMLKDKKAIKDDASYF